jgi:hypothetical protein
VLVVCCIPKKEVKGFILAEICTGLLDSCYIDSSVNMYMYVHCSLNFGDLLQLLVEPPRRNICTHAIPVMGI